MKVIYTTLMTVGWWGILYLFALLIIKSHNPIECANTGAIFSLLYTHINKSFFNYRNKR